MWQNFGPRTADAASTRRRIHFEASDRHRASSIRQFVVEILHIKGHKFAQLIGGEGPKNGCRRSNPITIECVAIKASSRPVAVAGELPAGQLAIPQNFDGLCDPE